MDQREIALAAAKALDDKRGKDIVVLKVDEMTVITDYMVIAAGRSVPQVKALAEQVEEELAKHDVFARRREIEIMKYVGATNSLVTLPFFVEGLAMGLISGALTAAISLGGYSYMVQASGGLGGVWEMIMGQALVPVSAVWSTIIPYSLIGGAVVGGLGSMFSIRKHLNV